MGMQKRIGYDIKLVLREPIMLLLSVLPLFLMFLFRFGLPVVGDFIMRQTGADVSQYNKYIMALAVIMTPYMTGTLAGFMMLDEKDGNILELVLVTPNGFRGYLFSRMAVPLILSLLYLIPAFALFSGYCESLGIIPGIALLVAAQTLLMALLLYSLASNKVRGLTIAKGLGILMLPMFFDLLDNRFLEILGYATPFYWVYALIEKGGLQILAIGLLVNLIWLAAVLALGYHKTFKISR